MITLTFVNLLVLFVFMLMYVRIKKQSNKQMFFDISVLSMFKWFVIPISLFVLNVILLLFLSSAYWYLPTVFVLVPVTILVIENIQDKRNIKVFQKFYDQLIPLIIENAKICNFTLKEENITIIPSKKKNHYYLRITLSINNKNLEAKAFKKYLEAQLPIVLNENEFLIILKTNNPEKKNPRLDLSIMSQ
jgi:hypothetical protein